MIGRMTLHGSSILQIFILYQTGIKLKKLGENGIRKIRILLLISIMMRILLNQNLNPSITMEETNKDFIDNFSNSMSNKIQQEPIQLVKLIFMIIIQN
jgi:hypothetical protein